MDSIKEYYDKVIKPTFDGTKQPAELDNFDPKKFSPDMRGLMELIGAIYVESKKPRQNEELDKLLNDIQEKRRLREQGWNDMQIKRIISERKNKDENSCRIILLFPNDPRHKS